MDFSRLPKTRHSTVPSATDDSVWWQGVMWQKKLFSGATGRMLGLIGMDREFFASGGGFFALETHIKSFAPLEPGSNVTIYSRSIDRSEKRFHFMHFLINDRDSELAATCEMVGAHVDLSVRRMAPLPPAIASKFDALLDEHNKLEWPSPVCGAMRP